jgi:hypothetical protein
LGLLTALAVHPKCVYLHDEQGAAEERADHSDQPEGGDN